MPLVATVDRGGIVRAIVERSAADLARLQSLALGALSYVELGEGEACAPDWRQVAADPPDRFAPPAPVAAPRIVAPLAFRDRLTEGEKLALYTAAAASLELRIYLDDLNAAQEVDLDSPRTVGGLQALVATGILTPERAAEILA
jgi:hypothetical protein